MYFMAGDYGKAGEYCDRAMEAGGDSPELYFYGASLSALAGDRDRSRELLEKALQQGFSDRAAILGSRQLAPIRNDPRFRQLLDRYLR
jgi:adenylate cyclase